MKCNCECNNIIIGCFITHFVRETSVRLLGKFSDGGKELEFSPEGLKRMSEAESQGWKIVNVSLPQGTSLLSYGSEENEN